MGVLSGEFAKERERVENRRTFLKLRKQQQLERELDGYLQWIEKAEEIIMAEEDRTIEEKSADEARRTRFISNNGGGGDSSDSEESMSEFGNGFGRNKKEKSSPMCSWFKRKERRLRVKVRHLIKTNYFYWTVIFLVFLNTIFLCSGKFPKYFSCRLAHIVIKKSS